MLYRHFYKKLKGAFSCLLSAEQAQHDPGILIGLREHALRRLREDAAPHISRHFLRHIRVADHRLARRRIFRRRLDVLPGVVHAVDLRTDERIRVDQVVQAMVERAFLRRDAEQHLALFLRQHMVVLRLSRAGSVAEDMVERRAGDLDVDVLARVVGILDHEVIRIDFSPAQDDVVHDPRADLRALRLMARIGIHGEPALIVDAQDPVPRVAREPHQVVEALVAPRQDRLRLVVDGLHERFRVGHLLDVDDDGLDVLFHHRRAVLARERLAVHILRAVDEFEIEPLGGVRRAIGAEALSLEVAGNLQVRMVFQPGGEVQVVMAELPLRDLEVGILRASDLEAYDFRRVGGVVDNG